MPRRARGADLWTRRLDASEVAARIVADHRPYHAALAEALRRARKRFGVAVLLDLHSMPSLPAKTGGAHIVLGDRFGRSAASRFVHRLEGEVAAMGLRHALNTPYAGGHILDRHGRPRDEIHAIQIEFDRALYLDSRLDAPGSGLAAMARLLRRMIDAAADEALAQALPLAAE